MATTFEQGGYCCEFVKDPPREVQVECPVCLQILREPYLVSCCGYSFCKVCIKHVHGSKKACPTCKEEGFTIFPNKGLQRMLNNFNVRCSNEKEGCKWTGELGNLDSHLNLYPQLERLLDGCGFTTVKCVHCSDDFKRSDIKSHQNEQCPKRPYSCDYCQAYKTHYDDVTKYHWAVCGSKPAQCPNNCGQSPLRRDLDSHIASECSLTLLTCDFPGCDFKIPRKDVLEHLQSNVLKHMSLLAASHKQLESENQTLNEHQKQLKSENQSLKRQIVELKTNEVDSQECLESMNHSLSQRVAELEAKLTESKRQLEGEYQSLNKRIIDLETKVRPLWKKIFIIGATNSGNPFD